MRATYWIAAIVYIALSATITNAQQIKWMWSGAATPTSIRVNSELLTENGIARLVVSSSPDFSSALFSMPDTAIEAQNHKTVSLSISGLNAGTRYYYTIEVNGTLDALSGSFKTFPAGAASFTFAFASCAQTGSTHAVFQTIKDQDPLFFFHVGDMHYLNISVNDIGLYRHAYDTVMASLEQSELYRNVPVAYMWDDHDFGPNNSDSTSPSKAAAQAAYLENVPHYPLVFGGGNNPITQVFSAGRVLFIVCDSRSSRSPAFAADNASKTMLGTQQKAWFKQELLNANGIYPLIVWVNTMPWIGTTGDDGWYLYTNERRELANFIKANNIKGVVQISGDAHMLAIDDGTNSDYATGSGAPIKVFQAAALDQSGSVKGGPYSHGAFPGRGQFGLFAVTDADTEIIVTWSGRNASNSELVAYTFAVSAIPVSTLCGDVNGEGSVNISDAVGVIQYVFAGGMIAPWRISYSDVNCDTIINIADAVQLVNYIFQGIPLQCACR